MLKQWLLRKTQTVFRRLVGPHFPQDPKLYFLLADLHRTVALNTDPQFADPKVLSRYGYKVFSQYDEDGIIQRIFSLIGVGNRQFVEIGVGDGLENNTLHLLLNGWHGVWIEGSTEFQRRIVSSFAEPLRNEALRLIPSFVTAENVAGLLSGASVPTEFDFLSIDIDGNDYYVWAALQQFRPRAVCVEYNAPMGPAADWKMPYDPAFRFSHNTMLYGASLRAFQHLADRVGYKLVGCSYSGVNAFFVRSDLVADKFRAPFDADTHYAPLRAYDWRFPERKYRAAFRLTA